MLINRASTISDPQEVKLSTSDFESGQDSTILLRERVRGSKLEGAYKKREGKLLDQSEHTITFLPAGSNQKTVISKRDLGNPHEQPCSLREADRRLLANERDMAELLEMPETYDDTPEVPETVRENAENNGKTNEPEREFYQTVEPGQNPTTKVDNQQEKDSTRATKSKSAPPTKEKHQNCCQSQKLHPQPNCQVLKKRRRWYGTKLKPPK